MTDPLHPAVLVTGIRITAFVISVALAMWIASHLARRAALDASRARRIMAGGVIAGLVAARLAYAAVHWVVFAPQPWTILYFWAPGYLPVAGLAGGALYLLYQLRRPVQRLPYLRTVTSGLAAGALLLAASLIALDRLPSQTTLRAGDRVPDFQLVNLEGDNVALSSLKGKAVVLNFWATWCPPCREEMPLLESAWEQFRSRNVVIVGIALGQAADTVRPFVDSNGISYPVWTDPDSEAGGAVDSNAIFDWFDSAGVPTTVFIRPDGVIAGIHVGELHATGLMKSLEGLIAQ